jgi:hypothetical protein
MKEAERTWVVKFRISGPRALIPEVEVTGPDVYTEADVDQLNQRLRDGLPLDSPRQLLHAAVEEGAVVGFFETTIEPTQAEYDAMLRFTLSAFGAFRRPKRFEILGTYPITMGPVEYLP